jgi:hypothetical protein
MLERPLEVHTDLDRCTTMGGEGLCIVDDHNDGLYLVRATNDLSASYDDQQQ